MTAADPAAGMWSIARAAEHAGVKPVTIRSYMRDNRMPPPDRRLAGRPFWLPETIVAWHAGRPGPGARTDLRRG